MTIRKLASEIAKREGKKSQARIGDIREILAVLSDIRYENPHIDELLWKNGDRREKARLKKMTKKKTK